MAVDLTAAKILACLRARETRFTGAECQETLVGIRCVGQDERGHYNGNVVESEASESLELDSSSLEPVHQ